MLGEKIGGFKMGIIEGVVAIVIAAGLAIGGYWVGGKNAEDSVEHSRIAGETQREASKSAVWAKCADGTISGKNVGQNSRDCNEAMDDLTTAGAIRNFENCVNTNKKIRDAYANSKNSDEVAPQLDCEAIAVVRKTKK